MGEAGGPAIAEMPQLNAVDRVRGKLQKWFKETFTIEGRANAMAQKQMDAIVASQPEELRAKAMELLESKRPDFVTANLPGAKGALVRDAAIGAAVVGAVTVGGGVAWWNKEWLGATRIGKGISGLAGAGKERAGKVVNWILRRKDYGGAQVVEPTKGWDLLQKIKLGGAGVVPEYPEGPTVVQSVLDKLANKKK